ncbi:hydroxyisourate hydrolase [Micromonospora echinofusca]|uniref:5-hydroxyisourate hydrolase n=1 Tax=Micromonospora echinofusca TaxID=47858 RepID=A0ABS3VIW0_MICEH|nr:hydroxyisourate hydrolase [Micromonospora echinofusca]MBO4204442.1 hydroxyisourate hydrolase [Micromonospora echinofusca]
MNLSTHVLDTSVGEPVAGLPVSLHRLDGRGWTALAAGVTDSDGRWEHLVDWYAGRHRLTFDISAHRGAGTFFPCVAVEFDVTGADRRTHIPLLISEFGYTTYRGC